MKGISKLAVGAATLCLGLAACTAAQENGSASESPSPTPQGGASGGTTSTAPTAGESTSAPNPSGSGTPGGGPQVTAPDSGSVTFSQSPSSTGPPVTPAPRTERNPALDMTPEEAMNAVLNGQITMAEYCSRDTFLTSGDTQMCYYFNHPESTLPPPDYGERSWRDSPTRHRFTYYEAYTAWQQGMPYYEAFCLNYVPVTPEGESQCIGIESGTVDSYTGEYIGP